MRTATDNYAHRRHQGVDFPDPDAEDLEHLRDLVASRPDRPITTGPCIERLRFAGFLNTRNDPAKGVQFELTEGGRQALAEAGLLLPEVAA